MRYNLSKSIKIRNESAVKIGSFSFIRETEV